MAFTRTGRTAMAVAAAAALAAVAPAASQAHFTAPFKTAGSGSSISGIGSSLQADAQNLWTAGFASEFPGLSVTYSASSSSAGLSAFGAADGTRDATNRFAATDEPPTDGQLNRMDRGGATAREIPVASESIAVIVHFPDGCAIPADAAYPAGPITQTSQFVVSNAQLENAFAGDPSVATWGELLPSLTGTDANGNTCADLPIVRVARSDDAGTTFVFKRWLKTINHSRGWKTGAKQNLTWPNDSGATAVTRTPDTVANGDFAEAAIVSRTDGSIGYASLSTARDRGFDQQPGSLDNDIWIPIHDRGGNVVEPTSAPSSFTDGTPGANCAAPAYENVPTFSFDPTASSWRSVTAAKTSNGYPLCALTYDLAWNDSSVVYGDSTSEQAQQRTVKDYLGYVLGTDGQAALATSDYSPLPADILKLAKKGQKQVGWNKFF